MKLYSLPPSPNNFKITALANHLGLALETLVVDMAGGQNQTPDYLAKNPNGLMPTLEDGDFHLWESAAILKYLALKKPESGLYPADPKQQALVDQWLHWHGAHWAPAIRPFFFERIVRAMFRGEQPDQAELAKAEEPFHKVARVLEQHLTGRQFMVGDQLTIADFCIAANQVYARPAGLPMEKYPNFEAYSQRILAMDCFKKAIPPMGAPANR